MTLSGEAFAKALGERSAEVSPEAAARFGSEAFAAHPAIRRPDPVEFARAVAERLEHHPLSALTPADLFLAQGAVAGDPVALKAFSQLAHHRVPRVLASMRPSPALVEEVDERLQEKLIVCARGKKPKLSEYQGTGTLAAWVGVAAVRIAIELIRLKRYQNAVTLDEGSLDARLAGGDPEFDLLKSAHSRRFKEAFQAAFVKLPIEDRSLLRMHLKDGLSIDQLGVMFQIHRATAARRIGRAKEALLEGVRVVLSAKFRMSDDEIDSDLRKIEPNLDLSLSRLLLASDRRP